VPAVVAISREDKSDVEELFSSGVHLNDIAAQTGYAWREVSNYLHGRGLTRGEECWIPWEGITKKWLLDHAHIDIRKRNKAIRHAAKARKGGLSSAYHELCQVEGSPAPYRHRGGECGKCPKQSLCSAEYVRCESVQDWEDESVDEILKWIENHRELYEDCYPAEEE